MLNIIREADSKKIMAISIGCCNFAVNVGLHKFSPTYRANGKLWRLRLRWLVLNTVGEKLMDEKIARTIAGLRDWKEYQAFTKNAAAMDRLTPEVKAALDRRSVELGRELVAQKTGLNLTNLSTAEEKIVLAVSQYVALKELQSSHATRTFDQLRNRGLIGAAESAVCRGSPTEGFRTLSEANHSDISYEQIVVDHADEFSERANWYSRRALGMPNELSNPPAQESSDTQTRTKAFIAWLKNAARGNDGVIPSFSNEEAAAAIGLYDMQKYGRAHGNMQSRIDFACYRAGLPPLGLAAEAQFELAWSQERRTWDVKQRAKVTRFPG
ncbi:hypothetical protein [Chromobacterium paludis]|uniref:Uncharacterized protein n=1 Tax=Chromobacterium paludis TaxID=2605945 RepID=A0A5C1DEG5_9NEIS|nr:hypothetical protein [Chromobacterium paludis]QEL55182.1 hypothetical protein FYK34_06185 [Chromobacterium paludis]